MTYIIQNAEFLIYFLIFLILLTSAIIFYKVYFFKHYFMNKSESLVNEVTEKLQSYTLGQNMLLRKDKIYLLLDSELISERRQLEKYLPTLANISSTAPLLGLLGTILGMMRSTKGIIDVDNTLLLKGISEALITTAIGIFIAIPAIISYNYFIGKIEKKLEEIKEKVFIKLES